MSEEEDEYTEPLEDRLKNMQEDDASDSYEEHPQPKRPQQKIQQPQYAPKKKQQQKQPEEEEEEEEEENEDDNKYETGQYKQQDYQQKQKINNNNSNMDRVNKSIHLSNKRRISLCGNFDEKQQLFKPEYRFNFNDDSKEKMWNLMDKYLPRDITSIKKSIVKHIEYTLAKTKIDVNKQYVYQGTSLSVRDRLLEQWNDTQLYMTINNPKKVFYMSIEFL